jgi:hypothetical protein
MNHLGRKKLFKKYLTAVKEYHFNLNELKYYSML